MVLGYTAEDGKNAGPEEPAISSTATVTLMSLLGDTEGLVPPLMP